MDWCLKDKWLNLEDDETYLSYEFRSALCSAIKTGCGEAFKQKILALIDDTAKEVESFETNFINAFNMAGEKVTEREVERKVKEKEGVNRLIEVLRDYQSTKEDLKEDPDYKNYKFQRDQAKQELQKVSLFCTQREILKHPKLYRGTAKRMKQKIDHVK